MDPDIDVIRRLYDRFNERDIAGVLSELTEGVVWANGMDGGYVHGREGVEDYWTRQWALVSPHVEPVRFTRHVDNSILVEVVQTIRDLQGKALQNQTHGLRDKAVLHVFRLDRGKVTRFDIQ